MISVTNTTSHEIEVRTILIIPQSSILVEDKFRSLFEGVGGLVVENVKEKKEVKHASTKK